MNVENAFLTQSAVLCDVFSERRPDLVHA